MQLLRLHLLPLLKPMKTPPRVNAIYDNQSLSDAQKKTQFEALHQERRNSFKKFLSAEQIAKMDQMKMNHGDGKEKVKMAKKR